jgi:hypothetical protein
VPGTRTSWSWSRCCAGSSGHGSGTWTRSTTWSRRRWPGRSPSAGRLDDEAVAPYAIVTARNLVISLAREEERSRRHRPRLVDPSEPERPEYAALRQEEAAAVETALAGLPDHEREAVVAHEIEGVGTATLAEARQSTPGVVGVQLARTRARLRLDYLLALRRVELPTARSRPVLLALPAGDRRRQLALTPAATSCSARPARR